MAPHNFDLTLGEIMKSPEGNRFLERCAAAKKGYHSWVESLYQDIDQIFNDYFITSSSFRLQDKEDRFNLEIVNHLKSWGYRAGHDTWTNGHPDIYVENPQFKYRWVAESKIHSDYGNNLKGFNQLCTRYTTGLPTESCGAMILITKNVGDVVSVMDKWKTHLDEKADNYREKDFKIELNEDNPLIFYSSHRHHATGLPYRVKHLPLIIHFAPEDK